MATLTPKEHVEEIRTDKFSIGGKQNPLTEDLHQSVKNLSAELYAKDVHFLMEIIQNAEDNVYGEGVKPALEFVVTSKDITGTGATSTLLVFNNEIGFSAKNIESICSVGRSTKKGQRQKGYIGEKGIGFKSVFLITAQPYIFSNGYQIKLSEEPCPHCGLGYIVPEWVEENPTLTEIQDIYGSTKALPATTIVLPLKSDKVAAVKQQLSSIHPEVLLFLAKIRRLSVREDNKDPRLNTVTAVSISSETDFITRKNVSAESYTLHLSAEENSADSENDCSYYMWRQKFPVNSENKVERRMEVDELVITLAFPIGKRLNRGRSSPGIYAFLPTEMITNFPFIIQADFVLASSRETILLDNKWNQGILNCVPSAFVNAFIALVKTSETAPTSSLAPIFEFLPVDSSSYVKLNTVRDAIKDKLVEENIVPSESYTMQKFFHKPSEVGRIMPAFWNILIKAKKQGVSMDSLSSHGRYALNSAFDKEEYDDVLNFLGVRKMDADWYAKCIQSSDMVMGASEDVYLELLVFISESWNSSFKSTNMIHIPLLKYVGRDGKVYVCTANEAIRRKTICVSYDSSHSSWLIEWNGEFRCAADHFFMPEKTQEAMRSSRRTESLLEWLVEKMTMRSSRRTESLLEWLVEKMTMKRVTVNDFAVHLLDSVSSERRLAIAFSHFLYHSLLNDYLSDREVGSLCKKIPLVDNYGGVTTNRGGVLVPARGSKWMELIGSNPWRGKGYVELGEDYLRTGFFGGVYTSEKQLIKFLIAHVGACDIPNLCPPDDAFPAVSSPLTKENALLLLQWIRYLKRQRLLVEGKFLRCIKEGRWLRTNVGYSNSYMPPSQSFILPTQCGSLLQNGSELVDIPLVDQKFYDEKIIDYKEELKSLGVMTEFGEACQYMGKRLMSLAANSNLTRANVFSILDFIKFLRQKLLPPEDFVKSVKEGRWLRTSHGERCPVGSILFDSEWKDVSKISNLPFVDQDYYGDDILRFRTELQLLGVVVGFDHNYQRVVDHFRMPKSPTSMTVDAVLLVLKCIHHSNSPNALVTQLVNQKWLKTSLGYRTPSECFLPDSEWGSLLMVFECFPLITPEIYGPIILSYKSELKKLGVVVEFEDAAKVFARRFKEHAASGSIAKENVFSLLHCYRQLKKITHRFPREFWSSITEVNWLITRTGLRSPKESLLFFPDWEHLSQIALLPFIQEGENGYGDAIREYKDELQVMGVTTEFKKGSRFVAFCLWMQNPSEVTPASVLSLLQCVRNILEERKDNVLKELLGRVDKSWLKTSMGYRPPNKCLLFGSDWSLSLQREDGPFIDEKFYGPGLAAYKKELNALGVIVDFSNGSQLLASELESNFDFDVISRIYKYLQKVNWEPKKEVASANWVWIPNGSHNGRWVSPDECVVRDKDGLFGLLLNVLEKHYEKELLSFFSMSLGVRTSPSVDDYYLLWKTWEESGEQLTNEDCCAFWVCIGKHWSLKTKKLLEGLERLPVNIDMKTVQLVDKRDVFIPDDLLLKDLLEKKSPNPLFVWYPQPSLPSLPRTKIYEIYCCIGVRTISETVQNGGNSILDGKLKQVNSREMLIPKGFVRLLLGFIADPTLEMDANKRQTMLKPLVDVNIFETEEPITVSYSLPLSSGNNVDVKSPLMIRWEREDSKLFTQKIDRSSGQKTNIVYATYFSQVIAEGLLWEKVDRVGELSELIKLGWLLEFEEEAVEFLLKTKNLQLFMEDEEFLNSAYARIAI